MKKFLLKGGRVIDPATQTDDQLDVLITDGKIAQIAKNISDAEAEVIKLAPGQWVTPGLIDIHVHFRDPGGSEKETTATGAAAAIAGGFTTVCIMPNTSPVIDGLATLHYVNNAAAKTGINILAVPAVTKNLEGKELTSMSGLLQNGAVGFTDDGVPIANANIMRKALEYSSMFGAPIICHAEDTALCGCGVMHEGYYSTLLGLPGIPSVAETTMIARDIQLAKLTGGHVHFAHITAKESVDLIREAKQAGLKVTSDTTPHNLALTDKELTSYNPNFKMYGPLRSEEDRQALIAGLKDGTIDAVATDHAPHTPEEKALTMDSAPRGVIGLETSLGVMLTNFYHTKTLKPIDVIRLMTSSPAAAYGLKNCGTLAVGQPADVTVIDPELAWIVDPAKFKSKSRNTPFAGKTLKGKAVKVFAKGRLLYEDDQLLPFDATTAYPTPQQQLLQEEAVI